MCMCVCMNRIAYNFKFINLSFDIHKFSSWFTTICGYAKYSHNHHQFVRPHSNYNQIVNLIWTWSILGWRSSHGCKSPDFRLYYFSNRLSFDLKWIWTTWVLIWISSARCKFCESFVFFSETEMNCSKIVWRR